ncbi:AraC-like DNA-binding protein [Litorivivens lipolytica]|uniref:AraC-like DNA-binding protein n=1 Tax=Litorivivens lipolytica TaxID=1524264 RepID=A0A7W4W4B7_9GAMM|nr:AraC family transcriptional regulator [Litorivivens lipolytica]MBB3047226.1 AraC-like DNA-binding protein [Litorivivens lipolytica]
MSVNAMGKGDKLIAVEYLAALQELAFERGIEPQQVLAGTGLPMDVFIRDQVKIGSESMVQVIVNCPALLNDPLTPYDYARRLTLSRHGTLGFAISSCSNLRQAIELLCVYIGIRVETMRLIPELDAPLSRVVLGGSDEPAAEAVMELNPAIAELFTLTMLSCLALMAKQFIGRLHDDRDIRILTVFPDRGVKNRSLQPPLDIEFNADCNAIVCPAELLNLQPALHNPELSRAALAKCAEELDAMKARGITLSNQVRELLYNEADKHWLSVEEVAAALFMSPTSLKRKLGQDDTSFQRIKNSERFNRAIAMLEEGKLTVESIAWELGYTNASNFSKAFKGWTGHSPKDYMTLRLT